MKTPKIVSAIITPMPESLFDPMPEVHVEYDNGKKEMLFRYYPDEICFNKKEFYGLTKEEALALYHKKDVAYLQA